MPVASVAHLKKSLQSDLRDRVDGMAWALGIGLSETVRERFATIDNKEEDPRPILPEFKTERTATGALVTVFIPAADKDLAKKARRLNVMRGASPFGSTQNELRSKRNMLKILREQGIE